MNPRLSNFLDKCNPASADDSVLDDLCREMEEAVPDIIERIKRRGHLAAQLRIARSKPSQANIHMRD